MTLSREKKPSNQVLKEEFVRNQKASKLISYVGQLIYSLRFVYIKAVVLQKYISVGLTPVFFRLFGFSRSRVLPPSVFSVPAAPFYIDKVTVRCSILKKDSQNATCNPVQLERGHAQICG